MADQSDAERLENLWAGEFGDAYRDRNAAPERGREAFWTDLAKRLGPRTALELGCNIGGNLHWLARVLGEENCAGIDISDSAIAVLSERLPGVDARVASARDLPFEDGSFDLVYTVGVLIHQPPESLGQVMSEVVRCSRRWVMCAEYADTDEVEVPYHGEQGALYRRDYGELYAAEHPELTLVHHEFLARGPESSWDDVTVWVFEKPAG